MYPIMDILLCNAHPDVYQRLNYKWFPTISFSIQSKHDSASSLWINLGWHWHRSVPVGPFDSVLRLRNLNKMLMRSCLISTYACFILFEFESFSEKKICRREMCKLEQVLIKPKQVLSVRRSLIVACFLLHEKKVFEKDLKVSLPMGRGGGQGRIVTSKPGRCTVASLAAAKATGSVPAGINLNVLLREAESSGAIQYSDS